MLKTNIANCYFWTAGSSQAKKYHARHSLIPACSTLVTCIKIPLILWKIYSVLISVSITTGESRFKLSVRSDNFSENELKEV